jgi:hypothetical protein
VREQPSTFVNLAHRAPLGRGTIVRLCERL